MRDRLAELGSRELSPLAMLPFAVLIVVVCFWVPIRLSLPDTAWAEAAVVEKDTHQNEDATFYNVRYGFVHDGAEYTGSSEISEPTYRRINVGDTLAVQYARGAPSVNRYPADWPMDSRAMAIGGLWALLIPLLPVAWWRQRRKAWTIAERH